MKSERESAWREMAKQIAHEIKNPLTPMRLQLQHLQKTKMANDPGWDKRFMEVSDLIIKQIDALSSIATEFSNFAKMPKANNSEMELEAVLLDTVKLFNEDKENIVTFDSKISGKSFIYADREQLQRVFINLVKNAIQSVAEGIKPEIKVILTAKEGKFIVEVKDNGKGVPEELSEKLFSPSFTTKSSGTGLGLAIVKKIVENVDGKIWFTTMKGLGSSFYIELPEHKV